MTDIDEQREAVQELIDSGNVKLVDKAPYPNIQSLVVKQRFGRFLYFNTESNPNVENYANLLSDVLKSMYANCTLYKTDIKNAFLSFND